VPGFEAVLEEAGDDGVGLYLLCDVKRPGAVVRGWSAGMGGVMRVYFDGAAEPVFEGAGYDFMARRSRIFLEKAGLDVDCGDAFIQQDADYFPMPFAKGLRVTCEGKLQELHFYHLQVRVFEPGVAVKTFDPATDMAAYVDKIYRAVNRLTHPSDIYPGEPTALQGTIGPGVTWECPALPAGPAAVTELSLKLRAVDLDAALRGTLLRIAFDGASKAQVEAPAGDFFGVGPGVHPFDSMPFSVAPDGTMTCRFVMPYAQSCKIWLFNTTDAAVDVEGQAVVSPWEWDDRSLFFRAKWRVDHDLDVDRPFDLPFVFLRGTGRFVGVSVQIMNPTSVPTPAGNWWGEGDEKVYVDDEPVPCAFGTGSEDYFNYSWSRPDLFDHPYCGQPLDSGPGNAGYVTNYRWQLMDAIPFDKVFAFYMELYHHYPFPGISYGRTAYLYTRPGAIDDHRRLLRSDLKVPPIPPREPAAVGAAGNSVFHHFDALKLEMGGKSVVGLSPVGPSGGRMVLWNPEAGATLTARFPVDKAGEFAVNIVAAHRPDGGTVRVLLDGETVKVRNLGGAAFGRRDSEELPLKSHFAERRLSTAFHSRKLEAGEHTLTIECREPGSFGFDYLWVKRVGD